MAARKKTVRKTPAPSRPRVEYAQANGANANYAGSPLDPFVQPQTEYERSMAIEERLSKNLIGNMRRTRKMQQRIEDADPLDGDTQELIFQLPGEIRMYLHALHEYTTFTGRMLRRKND